MKTALSVLTLATTLLFCMSASAHEKVVVIPLYGTPSNGLYVPLAADSPAPSSYTDNNNGTITDTVTGLTWQKEDDNVPRSWIGARNYCQLKTDASMTDWRAPTIDELQSIVDYNANNPSVNISAFPNTNAGFYWSETVSANLGSDKWVINFDTGSLTNADEGVALYVRCVR